MKKMYKCDYGTLKELVEDVNRKGVAQADIVGIYPSDTGLNRYYTLIYYAGE